MVKKPMNDSANSRGAHASANIGTNASTNKEPPKIEFPCENYPVKIMGEASEEYIEFVLETTETFAPEFDRSNIRLKHSSKGRFTSVTVFITATGIEQLEEYHQALRVHEATKIVL